MSTIEDRLDAAASAVAATVTADSVPPLDLSGVPSRIHGRSPRRRRGFAVLAPLAAATAVVAVIASAVAFSGGNHAPRQAAAGAGVSLPSVPRYYMALVNNAQDDGSAGEAIIRDTLTGATVASVRTPPGFTRFFVPTGAPDDRTFVLAAQPGNQPGNSSELEPTQLYLAHFNPARRSLRLTPLLAEFPLTEQLVSLAVSPNGRELAVGLWAWNSARTHVENAQIRIYSLDDQDSAPVRVWTAPVQSWLLESVYWARTGVLAFNWDAPGQGVRLLRVDTRSGSLLGDSRLALGTESAQKAGEPSLSEGYLTGDGKTIVAALSWQGTLKLIKGRPIVTGRSPKVEEFSAATGKLTRTFGTHWPISYSPIVQIIWANSSGSVVVVWLVRQGIGSGLAVVSRNKFEAVPGAPLALTAGFAGLEQFAF